MSVTEKPRATGSLSAPMPAPPVRQFSFTDWQVNNPTAPPPGDRLDSEFDQSNSAITDVIDWASVSLNTDGSIRDGVIGENNLQPDLFDDVANDAIAQVQPLVDQASVYANVAAASATDADNSASNAASSASKASGSAATASTFSASASAAASSALSSQNAAAVSATSASNSENDAEGAAALAQDYAVVTQAWAEHMPDPIPPNILSVMGVTGDHWSARWWAHQAALNVGGPFAINVRDYGAKGDGVTDDTAAIQAAAAAVTAAAGGAVYLPAGTYLVSSPIAISSNTLVQGAGTGSVLTAASAWNDPGTYGADPYMFFTNKNYGAVPIVDDNITIQNLSFLWTYQNTGAAHSIRFTCASNIKVMNCRSDGGGDHTALLGCTDTLIFGCSAYNGKNAAYDHWGYNGLGPTNARIIACYAQTANAAYQFVNFNAVSAGTPQPTVADGCIISNNEFVYTGTTQGIPINLNPMGSGNTTKNIIVANNKMTGNILVTGRGNCQAVSVSDNVMDVGGLTNAAIAFYTDGTDLPANISVTGNVIINPATSGANLGVIRVTCNGHFISGNMVTGSSFQTACYTSGFTGVLGPNNFSTGTGSVVMTTLDTSLIGDLVLTNQNAVSWFDTAHNRPRMYVQNDDNLVFYGTNGSGGTKFVFSNQQNAAGGNFIIGPGLQVAELSVNNMQLLGNSSGSPVRLIAGGTDTNIAVQITSKGNSGVMNTGYTRGAKPTTTDIPTGYGAVWSNSNDSSIKLYFNLAGTLYASPTLTTGNA